ncbi:hypothetical protein M3204_20980 [Mesobacillus subterraneus]|jgi:hypothetical protein|uniref:hypothetical protein n=1 Tax=Mesobacillus subterraneus TaxID=285983 RepID=UPI00203ECB7C|nr:hypothetical protein [Mesobacillus subterraneus]MCM3666879.1 hypothetical protein [Mesobacillus subterraneus]MCM3684947.1 hypothetical protein [Mesobacillus subterraneus]
MSGCCSPNYRKSVNEKEDQINQKGKEQLPFIAKIIIVLITAGGLLAAFLAY